MKIIHQTLNNLGGVATPALTASDLYFLAKSRLVAAPYATLGQPAATDKISIWYDEVPNGLGAALKGSTGIAGTSDVEDIVTPAFFPVATKGAECAAICNSLNWADQNLEAGYEFVQVLYSAVVGASRFFVSGVLNSSQTLSNDPFGTQGEAQGLLTRQAACWSGAYSVGVNPF